VEHLTAFTLTLDSLATRHLAICSDCANEHRYGLAGIAVARKKFLLRMANPSASSILRRPPIFNLLCVGIASRAGSTRVEPRTTTVVRVFILRMGPSWSGTGHVESPPRTAVLLRCYAVECRKFSGERSSQEPVKITNSRLNASGKAHRCVSRP
jgi:hypothetical protein